MNLALRVIAGIVLFAGAAGAAASIAGLAEGAMEAFWLLSCSLVAIEIAVLLRRLTRPIHVPRLLLTIRSRASFVLGLLLLLATVKAVAKHVGRQRLEYGELAFPLAIILVWILVWLRTRPSVWDVRPDEEGEDDREPEEPPTGPPVTEESGRPSSGSPREPD